MPRPPRATQPVRAGSVDLLRLAERIRARIPLDGSAAERVNRGTMSDIVDRLTVLGNGEAVEGAVALDAEDWCRIEGWGLLRRVRLREGGFVYEPSDPPPLTDNFALPPSVADVAGAHDAAPDQEARDLGLVIEQLRNLEGESLDTLIDYEHVRHVYLRNGRDVVNTVLDLQADVSELRSDPRARVIRMARPSEHTPWDVEYEPDVRGLADALARLSSATGDAQSAAAGLAWPLPRLTPPLLTAEPLFVDTEKDVSPLHKLVCQFIDAWDGPARSSPPSEFMCPISLGAMRQPVCAGDGHLYDRPLIEKAFRCSRLNAGGPVSPLTREKLDGPGKTQLLPCLAMISLMEKWVQDRVDVAKGETLESTLNARAFG